MITRRWDQDRGKDNQKTKEIKGSIVEVEVEGKPNREENKNSDSLKWIDRAM